MVVRGTVVAAVVTGADDIKELRGFRCVDICSETDGDGPTIFGVSNCETISGSVWSGLEVSSAIISMNI